MWNGFMFIPIFGGKKFSELTGAQKKSAKRNILIIEIVMAIFSGLCVFDFLLNNSSPLIFPGIAGLVFSGGLYSYTRNWV